MPKGKSKKFIESKNSVTFHLVHRSQQDPLVADETAPQRVLVPVGEAQAEKLENNSLGRRARRKEEQRKYGIFFDDEYDYLQHLMDVNSLPVEWDMDVNSLPVEWERVDDKGDAPKINLPSSVFASTVEEGVGLLNKAAPVSGPRLDYDPDIVAAMDDDFDYENPDNQLEDNFFEIANASESVVEFAEEEEEEDDNDDDDDEYLSEFGDNASDVSSGHMAVSEEERDQVGSLDGPRCSFEDEETKSRFTEYSMSSSVIKRNHQLTLLDDKFERLYAGYDENDIGPLDCEEIEGYVAPDSEIMLQYAEEFERQQREATENVAKLMKDRLKIIEKEDSSSDEEEKLDRLPVDPREREKWDCESILSTYDTIYNHPKLISEPKGLGKIKINRRTGIPKDVLNGPTGKLTAKSLAQLDRRNELEKPRGGRASVAETTKSTLSVLSVRPKDESPEERKERKKALKDCRRERRMERKANTEAFKEEKKRQEKIILNKKQNIQGNRIF